jgi:hypothetical protein
MKKIACFLIILLIGVAINADAKKKARKFYITQDFFHATQALTACADGYHMASLWEIFDTTNLRYDTKLGFTFADSGFGPPSAVGGRIRTGFEANSTTIPGRANCNALTSDSNLDFGTIASLALDWTDSSIAINPWNAETLHCGFPLRVWCVQD